MLAVVVVDKVGKAVDAVVAFAGLLLLSVGGEEQGVYCVSFFGAYFLVADCFFFFVCVCVCVFVCVCVCAVIIYFLTGSKELSLDSVD